MEEKLESKGMGLGHLALADSTTIVSIIGAPIQYSKARNE
jgi:hypothetical protein